MNKFILQAAGDASGVSMNEMKPIFVKEFFDQFIHWKKIETALSTYQNYCVVYNRFVPLMGEQLLQKITGPMLDAVFDETAISPSSRKTYQRILSTIFNDAIRQGYIEKNPCHFMRKIKQQNRKINLQLPTPGEIKLYIRLARKKENKFIYKILLLAISTGMRLGEILNLNRDDIDMRSSKINIRGQLTNAGANMPLKTSTSYRRIFVAREILGEVIKYTKGKYLFTPATLPYHQISRHTADKYIYSFFKEINTPEGFTFHSLRHYHATQLIRRGISLKEVSRRLGHGSINITADIYTHWLEEMDRKAARVFGKELLG